ncbi:Response regulator receiver domain-containing protein [Salegentibacter holothuriorum]|uniref:Response regulator receiver domain-containing protein n=1 Tax=Salegentibacter holothuriorum TaxID=241145 RepID=A0A1T5AKJ1_9FLAO|nr:response regulator [Salegentibacter holothuriorum]SKB35466.1 Response regulator receiver domain-containing protein [Salegentibacter holothuriorum]
MKKINLACLIEDDPIHIFLSKKYLEMTGRIENIMICQNGKEAYDKLKAIFTAGEILPELILLDLNMPIWDGWQFLEKFKGIPLESKITIYILTSSISEVDREKARHFNNVNNYVVKPIKLETLVELLDEMDKEIANNQD